MQEFTTEETKAENRLPRWAVVGVVGLAVFSAALYLAFRFGAVPPTSGIQVFDGDISKIAQARSLHIENDWTGKSPVAPVEAHYDLTRQDNGFMGKANFSVAGYTTERTDAADVDVPLNVAQDFLSTLAKSPLTDGRYTLGNRCCDDYPSILIEIKLENGSVKFYSQSQGEDHVPWGLDQLGSSYTINSSQPATALALLKPYLKEDVLERLVNQP